MECQVSPAADEHRAEGGERGFSQSGRKYMWLVILCFILLPEVRGQGALPEGPLWKTVPFKGEAAAGTGGVNARLTSCFEHQRVTWRSLLKFTSWRLRFQTAMLLQFEKKSRSVKSPCLKQVKLGILATHKPLQTFNTWHDAKQSVSGKPPNFLRFLADFYKTEHGARMCLDFS